MRGNPASAHSERPDRSLERSVNQAAKAPSDRGRALNAKQVAAEILGGHVSESWVRRNLRHLSTRLGHSTVVWFEGHLIPWLDSQQFAREER